MLAQAPVHVWGFTFEYLLVLIVVLVCAAAVVVIVIKNTGIQVPAWFLQILLLIFLAFVAVVSIRLLFAL